MAKSRIATVSAADSEPQKDTSEVYNEHNDKTAQDGPAEKQCQCKICKGFRGE